MGEILEKKYYSQNGEDVLLWRVFANRAPGIFVDIGAHNGLALSNTLSFEQQGWTGLCVEAHPVYAKECTANRKAIVVHAAAGKEDKDSVAFYLTAMGHLSTLNKSSESYFRSAFKKHFTGFKEVKVPLCTVNTLLDRCKFDHIDFISIDVEGTELDVLHGFDIKKFKPRIVLSEAMHRALEQKLIEYMTTQGYIYARKTGYNLFFCANEADVQILRAK